MKPHVFKDRVKITATAGNGGDGLASFRREKYVPHGGPDGGDGGRGGHIVLKACKDEDSLLPLYFRPLQRAGHGGKGGKQQSHGRNGEDLVIRVPCGTIVNVFDSGATLGEVVADGDEFQVARGGNGGKGNSRFVKSSHQAPTEHTTGEAGESKILRLELKMVAHVGLVGYPNAGKSTLLRALTAAHPKVASYPFTTLHPMIGTLIFEDYSSIRVADIPGLIDGATEGAGLGHEFLRHIERTQFLVYVIDMAGTEGRHPAEDYRNLKRELKDYHADLIEKPCIIVANKMDEPGSTALLAEFREQTGESPLEASAEIGEGVEEIRETLYRRLRPAVR